MGLALGKLPFVNEIREKNHPEPAPRILFLIDDIESIPNGGTERQILHLILLARRLGYAPRVAVLHGTEWMSEEQAGCPIYFAGVTRFSRPAGWRAVLQLVRWIRREKIALVQTFFNESNLVGPWMARLAGVPVVIGSRLNLNHEMGSLARQVQRLANLSVDYILANSHVAAKAMATQEWLPQRKLRVAYNGIDLARFTNLGRRRQYTRQRLGISENEILVGNISSFRPVKGMLHFIEAARIVLARDRRIRFVLVGDGEQHCAAVEQVRRYGLQDRVHFAGAQTDVFPYLAAMDIGVLSSFEEGFSHTLLEYMASGLPVIATDVGGNREALGKLQPGEAGEGEAGMCQAGILVAPKSTMALAEAILRLDSAEVRERFGAAGRRRAEQFSMVRADRGMEELYREMLTV